MSPPFTQIVKEILSSLIPGSTSTQIISEEDCSTLLIHETSSPSTDIACVIFPSVDDLNKLQEIDKMVDARPLILFNKQFKRPSDFGFKSKAAETSIFNAFKWGYALQEFSCRGEEVKLIFDGEKWSAVCLPDADTDEEVILVEGVCERPEYDFLTERINDVLPEPLWQRQMQKAKKDGLKFLR